MPKEPLISVYLPTFNRRRLLERAIKSVLNQSQSDLELLVVDDNSNDGTHELLSQISESDSRLRWWCKPSDISSGAPTSRNYAIARARGRFVTGLDDDDYFGINRLQNFIDAWDDLFVALFSNSININEKRLKYVARRHIADSNDLLCVNAVGSQIFTLTKTLKSSGGFDTSLSIWQDLELWYRLLSKNEGVMCNTRRFDYYFDESHELNRISRDKADKVIETFEYFIERHSLSKRDSNLLKVQAYRYNPSQMPWSSAFRAGKVFDKDFWFELSKVYIKKFLLIFHGKEINNGY